MKRKVYLIESIQNGKSLTATSYSKRIARALAKREHGTVYSIPLWLYNDGARPFGWDAITFKLQADIEFDFRETGTICASTNETEVRN